MPDRLHAMAAQRNRSKMDGTRLSCRMLAMRPDILAHQLFQVLDSIKITFKPIRGVAVGFLRDHKIFRASRNKIACQFYALLRGQTLHRTSERGFHCCGTQQLLGRTNNVWR